MSKIHVELDPKYREYLDLLKQIIPNKQWQKIDKDWEIVEVLIDEFIWFIQHQDSQDEWWCCGGWKNKGEKWWCWCHD